MNCSYCNREIKNKGSLTSHEMCCKDNPNKIKHKHSTNAGRKQGKEYFVWNKGKSFAEQSIQRIIQLVETGKLEEFCEVVARRYAKRYLLEKKGNICSICNTTEWCDKPVPLVCDHVSGDSTDNKIENFRLVCCNCDAQLPTYKSKNRGKGRKYDREYKRQRKVGRAV